MTDMESRLLEAGARWRSGLPDAPEPDIGRLAGRRRRWPAVAAAVGVAVVVTMAAVPVGRWARHESPTAHPAASRPATPGSAGPATPTATDWIVHDGDTVDAGGRVVVTAGQPVRFCPADLPMLSPESACSIGLTLAGAELDIERLTKQFEQDGTIIGYARVQGVLRRETIHVTAQLPYTPDIETSLFPTPPCEPPSGGWQASPDHDAIARYVRARPNQLNGTSISRTRSGIEVSVVGVADDSAAKVRQELRREFGPNICVVPVALTATDQQRIRRDIQQLAHPPDLWIYDVGCACGFTPVTVRVTMLNQERYTNLTAIGLRNLDLHVWVRPIT